jgi:hypothetical protein
VGTPVGAALPVSSTERVVGAARPPRVMRLDRRHSVLMLSLPWRRSVGMANAGGDNRASWNGRERSRRGGSQSVARAGVLRRPARAVLLRAGIDRGQPSTMQPHDLPRLSWSPSFSSDSQPWLTPSTHGSASGGAFWHLPSRPARRCSSKLVRHASLQTVRVFSNAECRATRPATQRLRLRSRQTVSARSNLSMWIVEPGHTEAEFKAHHMSSEPLERSLQWRCVWRSREESHGTR